jgi:uncharacterized membrane protein
VSSMAFFDAIYYAVYCFARHVRNSNNQSHALAGAFVVAFILIHAIGLYFLCSYLGGFKTLPTNKAMLYIIGTGVILLAITSIYYDWKKNGNRVVAEMEKRKNLKSAEKLGGFIVIWIIIGPLLTALAVALIHQL